MAISPISPQREALLTPSGQLDLAKLQRELAKIFPWPPPVLAKAIDQTLRMHTFVWKEGEHQLDIFKRAFEETVIYHGRGITHTPPPNIEPITEIVEYLLGEGEPKPSWMSWKHINAIFLSGDKELLASMQKEFVRVLREAASSLPPATNEVLFQGFVGNVIALLPYCYPDVGSSFDIPQKVDGVWKMCTYTVDKHFILTPQFFATPITAYGFVSEEGPPLISFLGTTFPASKGFLATLMADFTPGFSVGHVPYMIGKQSIRKWLHGKAPARLYGMSLGGALAFHALRYERDKIASVDAFSPPGLFPWNWQERYDNGPTISIYMQDNDIVPQLGYFPEGSAVNLYHVLPAKMENTLKAHARVYTGSSDVTLLKSSPTEEHKSFTRKILTTLHLLFSPLLFIPLLLCQIIYSLGAALRAFFRTIKKK